jgi:hypothetical protein
VNLKKKKKMKRLIFVVVFFYRGNWLYTKKMITTDTLIPVSTTSGVASIEATSCLGKKNQRQKLGVSFFFF